MRDHPPPLPPCRAKEETNGSFQECVLQKRIDKLPLCHVFPYLESVIYTRTITVHVILVFLILYEFTPCQLLLKRLVTVCNCL